MTTEVNATDDLVIGFKEISDYMAFRGQHMPNGKSAFQFALTEWGELLEELSTRSEKTKHLVRYEFGDTYQMLQLACYHATGLLLEECPVPSSPKYGQDITGITILMTKLLDDFLRLEAHWVRNNVRVAHFEDHFGEVFSALSFLSDRVAGATLANNLVEKWETKGYTLAE